MTAPLPPSIGPVPHPSAEPRRRILVGMGGLLLMLLLVMLAGYLSGQLRDGGDPKTGVGGAAANGDTPTAPPTEPLGDGAVDPSAAPIATVPDATLVTDGDGSIVVPDLEPDPDLETTKPGR